MNMVAYQEFVRIFDFVKKSREYADKGMQLRLPILRKKYKELGVTDDDVIVQLERRKTDSHIREVEIFLNSSQVFEIDDKHKYLLMLTNNPRMDDKELWKQVRLPFPEMFIDVKFMGDDLDFPNNTASKISGILIKEMKKIGVNSNSDSKTISRASLYGLQVYIVGLNADGLPFLDKINFPILMDDIVSRDFDVVYEDKKEADFIKQFVINFILFLKDREVVYVHSERSAKNQERRIKSGKLALPSSRIVKLTGQLKRYVDSLQENDFRGKLSYQFWVRGFWRHYRSAKYKNMKDKVVFVEPFRKGKGVLVQHTYRVLPKDEEDTLNYDDIEAGKKKLKDIAR
jgi:hypothetical protein